MINDTSIFLYQRQYEYSVVKILYSKHNVFKFWQSVMPKSYVSLFVLVLTATFNDLKVESKSAYSNMLIVVSWFGSWMEDFCGSWKLNYIIHV